MGKYQPSQIEAKWQQKWQEESIYQFRKESDKKGYYNLVELPYPSGDLHLGHWFAFVPPDVHARYMRMSGNNVFFPNGFDAFGLPAENAAIKRDIHPKDWTFKNIETMRRQFDTMGTMIDWSHQVITCTPEYYKWNQWIFLKMLEKGVAYRGKTRSNWCPVDQTVLANEHVENGNCWRCGAGVVQKEVEQWFLKITDYADSLLWPEEPAVNWPQSVREGQNKWIGRSSGALIDFKMKDSEESIQVFTTRPDTLFGATFLVLSPEHPLVEKLASDQQKDEVTAYVKRASMKSELERKENKEKSGVFTGSYAINPVNGEEIPVWVADYVLLGYGTGAIMAVPAHDSRDFDFAKKYNLGIKPVIQPQNVISSERNERGDLEIVTSPADLRTPHNDSNSLEKAYEGEGMLMNSGEWDGWKMPSEIEKVIDWLETKELGKREVTYHLRDWSISRQRYWGTPVPMIKCETCGSVPVPEEDLPVELPYDVDYTPQGKAPLASNEEWLNTSCPKCGRKAQRDPETLDTFFDSAWYYYRYADPNFTDGPFDPKLVSDLMPVSVYFGGGEHTLGHTLYARFFTKFFKDLGLVGFDEFAHRRVQHGVILGPDGNRMSKSKGNVVNPDDVVKEYGADTVRLYLCFMMPYDAVAPWDPGAIQGIYRFLRRIWDMSERRGDTSEKLSSQDLFMMHKTIKNVGQDLADIKFNTAVAFLMEWLNHLGRKDRVSGEEYKTLLLLLAPFAPHFAEELWARFISQNEKFESIHLESWPEYNEKYLTQESVTIAISVNGKTRGVLTISSEHIQNQGMIEKLAKEHVARYLEGKEVKNVVYVPGKIINFVS